MYEEVAGMEYLRSSQQGIPLVPTMTVSIGKIDNGYVLKLNTIPKRRMPRAVAPMFSGEDPDELIDKMVDAMGAFIRSINDKGAGEDWKEDGDRMKIREGFKAMFPSLLPPSHLSSGADPDIQPGSAVSVPEEPRSESRVFESKDALIRYLSEQL